MRVLLICMLVSGLAACGPRGVPPPEARIEARRINALDASALWRIQSSTRDPIELAQVEAELGSRGQFASGSSYLGRRTLAGAGRARYRRPAQDDPSLDGVNCDDFLTDAAAQAEFLGSGGPRNDRHKLDDDGDGLACDWADDLRRSVVEARRR
ncbi:hypothetical protein MWU52_04735 [Jannaschia sp. S6380]|uniref:hypothetical protein n=1 Tax=Jannaschia sp. S6380 TaxID=2926408 RepID=UPI001FF40DE9|nr:hypothetical protein [Jannaschia sp. S6380]MCK0166851.1 hypothetical protein [Jannaschia sp. S6380]